MHRLPFVILFFLTGCTQLLTPKIDLSGLSIVSQPGANRNTAIALDIVLVYRKELLPQLPDTAPEWFRNRAALEGKYRPLLEVIALELPPGDLIENLQLTGQQRRAQAVLLYANYLSVDAQNPINVTDFKNLEVRLQPERVQVSELNAKRWLQ